MQIQSSNISFRPSNLDSGPFINKLRHWIYTVLIELHPATSGCAPCRNFMLPLEVRAFHGIQPDIEVDVVFTWVDGNDPAHIEKRNKYLEDQSKAHENGLDKSRFRDNEELRYALRALEEYAPWVRKVILVTDEQCPAWIKRDHPKLRIVDHKEFIPKHFLPTFNSHIIEAYLHEIPDLSEHYIYLNDDVFLSRPCRKTDFFTANKLPLAFVDWRKRRSFGYSYTKTPHAMSYFNTLNILQRRGVASDPKFITAHGPYAQTRSNARDAFAFYKDIIENFAHNRFRTANEIAFYCHALPLWIYYQKRIVPCDERYYYVQTMRKDRIAYYKAILNCRKDHVPPLFFCINDVGRKEPSKQWQEDLQTLLTAYFPNPSSFENDAQELSAAEEKTLA